MLTLCRIPAARDRVGVILVRLAIDAGCTCCAPLWFIPDHTGGLRVGASPAAGTGAHPKAACVVWNEPQWGTTGTTSIYGQPNQDDSNTIPSCRNSTERQHSCLLGEGCDASPRNATS